jgi:hypothetical protein
MLIIFQIQNRSSLFLLWISYKWALTSWISCAELEPTKNMYKLTRVGAQREEEKLKGNMKVKWRGIWIRSEGEWKVKGNLKRKWRGIWIKSEVEWKVKGNMKRKWRESEEEYELKLNGNGKWRRKLKGSDEEYEKELMGNVKRKWSRT